MRVRVICHPKKLLVCLAVLIAVFIIMQISGYGIKDLEASGKRHVNLALPTMRNPRLDGKDHSTAENKMEVNNKFQNWQRNQELNKFTRTDHDRIDSKPTNHIVGSLLPNNNNIDGLQIKMPQVDNYDNMNAIPSNIPSNQYHKVLSDFLEKHACPACFGTSLCDQFDAGDIKLDTETDTGLAKIKYVYFGFWEGYNNDFTQHPLPVVVKRLIKDKELAAFEEYLLCNLTDSEGEHKMTDTLSRCDVGDKIMKTKLASRSIFQKNFVRKEFYKVAHDHPTSLGIAMCASQRLLDNITRMYNVHDKASEYSTDVAMLVTSFVINPEGLVTKFCHRFIPEVSKYFPKYYGECGRMIVVQPGGKPLEKFLKGSWKVRVDLAWQLLQMMEDFMTASHDWFLFFVDLRFDNFCVSAEGKIQLIDLEDVVIVDREEIKEMQNHHHSPIINEPCNVECLFDLGRTIYEDNLNQCGNIPGFAFPVMHMLLCQRLLSDLDTTKYIRMFDKKPGRENDHPGGLLHDIPAEFEPRLSELLYECVSESKPAGRLYAVKALKMLLGVIRNSFIE